VDACASGGRVKFSVKIGKTWLKFNLHIFENPSRSLCSTDTCPAFTLRYQQERRQTMNPWRLQELDLRQTKKNKFGVAIHPIGSTESHGYHLPYGSDAFHSGAIADHVWAKAWQAGSRVLLLPTLPYEVQGNTMGFPLTIDVRQRVPASLVRDIVDSLERHGIKKLLIMNCHGGDDFKPLLRRL